MAELNYAKEWLRTDLIAHVPSTAHKVLSVGCFTGLTEAELVKRGFAVVGIEINPAAAQIARSRGVKVIESEAIVATDQLAGERFDCLIYGDVLEHIMDPIAVLKSHLTLLNPPGKVIISVPNFRNYTVLWQLLIRGHVQYTDGGILDRTHVRITTRRMVDEWCDSVGLKPTAHVYKLWRRRDRLISFCSFGLLREFLAQQVIVVAELV